MAFDFRSTKAKRKLWRRLYLRASCSRWELFLLLCCFILEAVLHNILILLDFNQAQKAKDKEENEQLMEELDKNFSSLVQSEALLSLTEPGKMSALKALVNQSVPKEPLKITKLSATEKAETFAQVEFYYYFFPI